MRVYVLYLRAPSWFVFVGVCFCMRGFVFYARVRFSMRLFTDDCIYYALVDACIYIYNTRLWLYAPADVCMRVVCVRMCNGILTSTREIEVWLRLTRA